MTGQLAAGGSQEAGTATASIIEHSALSIEGGKLGKIFGSWR